MIATFALILAATNFLLIYGLHQIHTAHERRIKSLEARKPEPEKRVHAAVQVLKQPAQYEKPVVPGAKEVKPLPIGGGKQVLNYETQVAEWI